MQQSRQKLTEFETTMAFVIGGGLTLLVFAFALGSVRGNDADFGVLNIMALLGTLLMVVGTAVWAISNKVWLKREDFSKALYVGHEHDHHEEAPAAGGAAAGAHAGSVHHAPKAEPEIVAPATEAAPVKDIVAAASVVVETPKVEVAPAPVVETVASAPVSAPVVEIPKVEELAPVVVETPKAEAVPEAIQAKADDLETIEGIGPKSAAALSRRGRGQSRGRARSPAEKRRASVRRRAAGRCGAPRVGRSSAARWRF